MADIEFLVAFLGLLFGLALANISNNLADSWRSRRELPIGLSPIFFSAFIVLSIVQQWQAVAYARDSISIDAISIFTALGVSLPFIFASRALMPLNRDSWDSIEQFYIKERHEFLALLMVPPIASLTGYVLSSWQDIDLSQQLISTLIIYGLVIFLPLLMMLTKNVRLHRAGLLTLCIDRLVFILASSS